ncbi:MAG: hypothetical protein ACYTG2_04130 [Planctomycetota bacterium]|jgi:hypothetical protein
MPVAVRAATDQDVEPLSYVLARAFREDPLHRWIFPDERAWAKYSHRTFAITLRGEVGHDTVFTDAESRGAAIWRDPGLGPPPFWEQLRMAAPMLHLLAARSPLVLHGFHRLMALHPKQPHWYLSVLGEFRLPKGPPVWRMSYAPRP